ncbi:MAG: hypothetical protein ACI9LM_001343 [Alteromonadaceae bacterium]|jgi:hypothetical protein
MLLEKEDLIALNRTGENLKSVLRHIVTEFPHSAQTITGMSHWLEFNRSNCQRILNGLQKSKNGQQVLCLLPGIAGLQEFLIQVSKKKLEAQLVLEASKAIEVFESQIKKYARSHAELKRILGDHSVKNNRYNTSLSAIEKREQHYLASKQLIGSSVDTLFSCYIIKENDKDSEFLQEVTIISKRGIQRSKASPPFVQFYTHPHPEGFTTPENITKKSRIDTSKFHIGVIDQFSSKGFLQAYSSYSTSNSGIVFNDIVDNECAPFDGTFLFSNPDELANPLVHQSQCSSTSISIKNPTKKLLTLVFLEKKIDRCSTVNVGCYSGNQKVEEGKLRADDMWTERLPEFPELNVLHPESPRARINNELDIGEMTDFLFSYSHFNKNDFVCYLLEVDFPIWSSTYRVYFEHG